MLYSAPAEYVDGVVALHSQLNSAYIEAYKIASMHLPLPNHERNSFINKGSFRIFVDSKSERKPFSPLKGFFTFGGFICRFLPISIELAALFPVRDLCGGDDETKRKGLDSMDIQVVGIFDDVLQFTPKKDSRVSYPLFNIYELDYAFRDGTKIPMADIGLPYNSFSDILSLKSIDIPDIIKSIQYSLVGIEHYAPFTKLHKDIHCVLFAELDNKFDIHAIKVLRWFPQNREEVCSHRSEIIQAKHKLKRIQHNTIKYTDLMIESTGHIDVSDVLLRQYKQQEADLKKILSTENSLGDYFFELGYVSRYENTDLHSFMVKNNSRLLFGKINEGKISIIGGISTFLVNGYNFPFCLSNLNIE